MRPGQPTPPERHERVLVTPEVATKWLERNTRNRPIRQYKVDAYAEDMRAGRWMVGENLIIDWNGDIVTGQHRLWAVIDSECSVEFLVVFDADPDYRNVVDTGMPQQFADILRVKQEPHYSTLASIVRRVLLFERGDRTASSAKVAPTNPQLFEVLERYPELREIASLAHGWGQKGPLKGSLAGFLAWRFMRASEQVEGFTSEDVTSFFKRLTEETDHHEGDPVYTLRKALIKARSASTTTPRDPWLTAVTIKAWNCYVDGTKCQVLGFKPGGAKPERFPVPRGEKP